jgi:hypothetical protein
MGTYGLEGVIQAWELGKLTTEQAIGQILLLLAELNERISALEHAREEQRRRSKKKT